MKNTTFYSISLLALTILSCVHKKINNYNLNVLRGAYWIQKIYFCLFFFVVVRNYLPMNGCSFIFLSIFYYPRLFVPEIFFSSAISIIVDGCFSDNKEHISATNFHSNLKNHRKNKTDWKCTCFAAPANFDVRLCIFAQIKNLIEKLILFPINLVKSHDRISTCNGERIEILTQSINIKIVVCWYCHYFLNYFLVVEFCMKSTQDHILAYFNRILFFQNSKYYFSFPPSIFSNYFSGYSKTVEKDFFCWFILDSN